MKPEDYIPQITEKYPDEDPNDVVAMIKILAETRADSRGSTITTADFDFAGKILCVIFDPIKFRIVSFSPEMKSLRRSYRGISESTQMQAMFRDSLRDDVVSAAEAPEAIEAGVETLFRLPATFDE